MNLVVINIYPLNEEIILFIKSANLFKAQIFVYFIVQFHNN
ncbi:hypothetical protein [uncultured Gammaproteobacteria bacterium]|nr:hypothetical protein [uncultured Gammaproteobacteria bacterium]